MKKPVLADTSVWIRHLRSGDQDLIKLLNEGAVTCSPFVIGELACGNLKNRKTILNLLQALPEAPSPENNEILTFIEAKHLMGKGLGYVDVCLLAAALISGSRLWTLDAKLKEAAEKLGISY